MIKHISFKHGWFYHYRVHEPKLELLSNNGLSELKKYLYNMFENCPHENFVCGPRSSSLKFDMPDLNLSSLEGHEVCSLANLGLKHNAERYKTNHSKVQMFMLENDKNTLAMEVPIWLNFNEIDNFSELFDDQNPLSGHIDILRIQNDKIWIWDYKPNAHKEKYAKTQTYFYALMLSLRTGIPLEKFRCGYFDKDKAFIFNPKKIKNIL